MIVFGGKVQTRWMLKGNKRTECEPSLFVAAEGASQQPIQQMRNATQQRVLSGQPAKAHLWQFDSLGLCF